MTIERLPSNRPPARFYRGGRAIGEFRGEPVTAEHEPEDWVGSTTTIAGEERLGLTTLADGRLLRDAIEADPLAWLGRAHVDRFGADPKLLVKLLDAGQRLPVHAHPHVDFASRHLGRAHGKAEAWYILVGGDVHLGLVRDVGADELSQLVAAQDVDGLVGLLHRIPVSPGDVVYVPPGTLHAIGAGVLLLEVQEPEDLSILLEWSGFAVDGARDGHLGLGFELALEAVDRRGRTAEEIAELTRPGPTSLLPAAADSYFRIERLRVDGSATLDAGFAVVVVADGDAVLGDVEAPRGSTVLVPAAAGAVPVTGTATLLVCRPPA